MSNQLIDKTFYHLYTYDFRGRKYPSTAYLHEQGSDLAKGILKRADAKPIGEHGYNWLCISLANNWAGDCGRSDGVKSDKVPLKDRIRWSLDNKEILLSYAENPKVNQGWMKADKPWQFLAACNELLLVENWVRSGGNRDDFISHIECYIDGSNNGSQHLSALTKDEVTAPHVNLVPLELPGDLYKYVADYVWESIGNKLKEMPKNEVSKCDTIIDTIIDYKKQIQNTPLKSDRRKSLIESLISYKKTNEKWLDKCSVVYWARIVDPKQRRKVVKRNVMTLPYGGTPYGLGQQQIDDARKHGIEQLNSLEHKWGAFMGREVYDTCTVSLKRPMRLLGVFEAAGKKAEDENRFLKWNVPITGFPVVQHYTEGTTKKVYVQYGPQIGEKLSTGYYANTLQLQICFLEKPKLSKRKQSTGASPNAIHSLDAAHLTITTCRADFPITTVHDSFGCLLADMPKLFVLIRKTFVELYEADPLSSLMRDIGGDLSGVEMGHLDVSLILDSDYAFA